MAMIFINRNRQSLGQFTEQEVADGLKSGQFLPDDLAWKETMESWKPLSTFTDLPPASANVPPQLVSEPKNEEATAVEPAWERGEGGIGTAYASVKEILSRPVQVFRAMPTEGGFGRPLKFYVLVGWITGAVAIVYQACASAINPEMFLGPEAKNVPMPALVGIFVGFAIILPVFLIIGSFVSSGVMHLALMVVGGAKKPYEATYRALAYASGAASVAQLLPICGSYLYTLVSLVYSVIALKEAHRTEVWRPIVAIILVIVFCCGIGIALFAMAMGAVAALGHVPVK
jgi:hypothetical protein